MLEIDIFNRKLKNQKRASFKIFNWPKNTVDLPYPAKTHLINNIRIDIIFLFILSNLFLYLR